MPVSDLISPTLERAEERRLIDRIQAHPEAVSARSVDEAWETLIAAHQRAIQGAARRVPTFDQEDAYATALEAFVSAVRDFDLDLGLRLSTIAYPAMARAVLSASTADKTITIPRGVVERYLALMKKAEGDVNVAYRMAQEGGHEISPFNVLAAHRALADTFDADEVLGEQRKAAVGYSGDFTGIALDRSKWASRSTAYTPEPGHEEIDATMSERVFSWLTAEEAFALRLSYGFRSAMLDEARTEAGFRIDDPLNPRELGVVLARSRSAARRLVEGALTKIRDHIQSDLDQEEG